MAMLPHVIYHPGHPPITRWNGQRNSPLVNTFSLGCSITPTFQAHGSANFHHDGRQGAAPLSMPGLVASTNIDSRVAKRGNSLVDGVTITI